MMMMMMMIACATVQSAPGNIRHYSRLEGRGVVGTTLWIFDRRSIRGRREGSKWVLAGHGGWTGRWREVFGEIGWWGGAELEGLWCA